MNIRIAETTEEILDCFPVMVQLRPHLDADAFLERVQRQSLESYRIAYLIEDGRPVCVAGFRIMEKLYKGRALYVDDLITDEASRSKGHGRAMLDWLKAQTGREGCDYLELDSGVQRIHAHRFYDREDLANVAHHYEWPSR